MPAAEARKGKREGRREVFLSCYLNHIIDRIILVKDFFCDALLGNLLNGRGEREREINLD